MTEKFIYNKSDLKGKLPKINSKYQDALYSDCTESKRNTLEFNKLKQNSFQFNTRELNHTTSRFGAPFPILRQNTYTCLPGINDPCKKLDYSNSECGIYNTTTTMGRQNTTQTIFRKESVQEAQEKIKQLRLSGPIVPCTSFSGSHTKEWESGTHLKNGTTGIKLYNNKYDMSYNNINYEKLSRSYTSDSHFQHKRNCPVNLDHENNTNRKDIEINNSYIPGAPGESTHNCVIHKNTEDNKSLQNTPINALLNSEIVLDNHNAGECNKMEPNESTTHYKYIPQNVINDYNRKKDLQYIGYSCLRNGQCSTSKCNTDDDITLKHIGTFSLKNCTNTAENSYKSCEVEHSKDETFHKLNNEFKDDSTSDNVSKTLIQVPPTKNFTSDLNIYEVENKSIVQENHYVEALPKNHLLEKITTPLQDGEIDYKCKLKVIQQEEENRLNRKETEDGEHENNVTDKQHIISCTAPLLYEIHEENPYISGTKNNIFRNGITTENRYSSKMAWEQWCVRKKGMEKEQKRKEQLQQKKKTERQQKTEEEFNRKIQAKMESYNRWLQDKKEEKAKERRCAERKKRLQREQKLEMEKIRLERGHQFQQAFDTWVKDKDNLRIEMKRQQQEAQKRKKELEEQHKLNCQRMFEEWKRRAVSRPKPLSVKIYNPRS